MGGRGGLGGLNYYVNDIHPTNGFTMTWSRAIIPGLATLNPEWLIGFILAIPGTHPITLRLPQFVHFVLF